MAKKKKRKRKSKMPKPRNPFALPAKKKTGGGTHKNKADKRAKENKTPDYTKEE